MILDAAKHNLDELSQIAFCVGHLRESRRCVPDVGVDGPYDEIGDKGGLDAGVELTTLDRSTDEGSRRADVLGVVVLTNECGQVFIGLPVHRKSADHHAFGAPGKRHPLSGELAEVQFEVAEIDVSHRGCCGADGVDQQCCFVGPTEVK